ncbi:23S rRNA (adenine(1618)-N(6))-methyltransferase RlmF [Pontibacter saemangeumensis]
MSPIKKEHPTEKSNLHPRNKHRARYDFRQLTASCPELGPYVKVNNYQDQSIDFFDPAAVKMLNKALLKHYYGIGFWDIPAGYLCPPIPGRAEYIHHIADLLGSQFAGVQGQGVPQGDKIKCLDIGVGANCVYPIIGNREYGWKFVGSDIDPVSIESANRIIEMNPALQGQIACRRQHTPKDYFRGIIHKDEYFDLSICNPPFHASSAEASAGTVRKLKNLKHKRIPEPVLNFGGQSNELWCEGGEERFIVDMIGQSREFSASCFWFSTLVSKESSLKNVYKALKAAGAFDSRTIPMRHGNKTSRIVAWTFLTKEQRNNWMRTRWVN